MQLIARVKGCEDGNCPKISDVIEEGMEDTVAIQGPTLKDAVDVPGHESVVLFPRALLLEYADKIRAESAIDT